MNIFQNLFSRRGNISGRAYWIQCAVLLCAGIVLHLLAFGFIYAVNPDMLNVLSGPAMVAITFGLIALLFYPYLCLYTKRLRDAGVSPHWYLAIVLAYGVLFLAVPNVVYLLTQTSPADLFVQEMHIAPTLSEAETVAAITLQMQKTLIANAVFTALLHGILTIGIDVTLGKLKPRGGQKTISPDAVFA